MRIITIAIACVVALSAAIAGTPTQAKHLGDIMCLGDSITYGASAAPGLIPGGYRDPLYTLLKGGGYTSTFVGSFTDNASPTLTNAGQTHHQGWRGALIDASGANATRTKGLGENLSTWIGTEGAHPNIILLMIGTNDLSDNYDVAHAPDRLETLITDIYSFLPNVAVHVASLAPRSDTTMNNRVLNFNAALPGIVNDFAGDGKNIHYVDMYSALTTSDLYDGLHPNPGGYAKMANTWYGSINTNNAPEPSCIVLLSTGVVALLGYVWRRRRKI